MTTKQRAFHREPTLRRLREEKASHEAAAQRLLVKAAALRDQAEGEQDAAAQCEKAIAALEGQQPELPLSDGELLDTLVTAPSTILPPEHFGPVTATSGMPFPPEAMPAPVTETVATPAGAPLQPPEREPDFVAPEVEAAARKALQRPKSPPAYRRANIVCNTPGCSHPHTEVRDGQRVCSTMQKASA